MWSEGLEPKSGLVRLIRSLAAEESSCSSWSSGFAGRGRDCGSKPFISSLLGHRGEGSAAAPPDRGSPRRQGKQRALLEARCSGEGQVFGATTTHLIPRRPWAYPTVEQALPQATRQPQKGWGWAASKLQLGANLPEVPPTSSRWEQLRPTIGPPPPLPTAQGLLLRCRLPAVSYSHLPLQLWDSALSA